MSDIVYIVTKYTNEQASLEDTVRSLLSLHLGASALDKTFLEGTWSEVEKMLNDGLLSFGQYRALDREYRKSGNDSRKFVILGLDYGFIEERTAK